MRLLSLIFRKELSGVLILVALVGLLSFAPIWHGWRVDKVREEVAQEVRLEIVRETKDKDISNATSIRERVAAGAASRRMRPEGEPDGDTRGYRD